MRITLCQEGGSDRTGRAARLPRLFFFALHALSQREQDLRRQRPHVFCGFDGEVPFDFQRYVQLVGYGLSGHALLALQIGALCIARSKLERKGYF